MGLPLVPSATGVIQNMAPLTITIQIFSDTICPWSYIGKKDLEYAMKVYKEHHPDVHFETTWIPFYLNPKAKVSGETLSPFLPPSLAGRKNHRNRVQERDGLGAGNQTTPDRVLTT